MSARHPSDADRAAAARPVLEAALAAAAAGDAARLRALYADDAAWLAPEGTIHGGDAAAARHLQLAAGAERWDPPQQQGAKAALRFAGAEGGGAIVVEVRRDRIIFVAEG